MEICSCGINALSLFQMYCDAHNSWTVCEIKEFAIQLYWYLYIFHPDILRFRRYVQPHFYHFVFVTLQKLRCSCFYSCFVCFYSKGEYGTTQRLSTSMSPFPICMIAFLPRSDLLFADLLNIKDIHRFL